ncbi:MAG: glutaminyl-peptide cyclotransferase [Flavipsychrobacter sp.]
MRSILFLGFIFTAVSCNNATSKDATITDRTVATGPAYISYSLVKEYPHDTSAYTEGLQYVDGYLYESTGEYGQSDLRKTRLEDGKVLEKKKLDNKYFGEGLAVLNGKIYQLTYQEKTGFVYDEKTMKPERTFSFNTAEGWGMTTDGHNLIYDDGSNVLHYLNPTTLQETKHINVTENGNAVDDINELEYIKGYVYANQWQTDIIYKIDTATGNVVGKIDLSDLRSRTGIPPISNAKGAPEVLNGIAYDAANNRIFITGKYWPKIFEVKFDN